jgi:hypothetical protein
MDGVHAVSRYVSGSRGATRRYLAVIVVLLGLGTAARAGFITGPADPDYLTTFQGASAKTFADLGFTVGLGATDLKVSTDTWSDPSGFIFGTVHTQNGTASGTTTDKIGYGYFTYGATNASANARDYDWLQNTGTNGTTDPSLDKPWLGTIWDLGGLANQAVVFPIVDHGPLPQEVVEYTVYLTNDPTSTSLADWSLALLDSVYMQGWEADSTSLADGFTTVWKLPGGATFRYVSVQGIGSQALRPLSGDEDEIDAVGGLTATGVGVGGVPEPGTFVLFLAAGALGLGVRRRRTRSAVHD